MAELTLASEHHREVVFVGGFDYFLIPHRATGLHDCRHTRVGRLLDAIAEWEERIGSHHRTLGVVSRQSRFVNGEECRVDARHLAGADSNRCPLTNQHDGV